jgi:hypothetical protein
MITLTMAAVLYPVCTCLTRYLDLFNMSPLRQIMGQVMKF